MVVFVVQSLMVGVLSVGCCFADFSDGTEIYQCGVSAREENG